MANIKCGVQLYTLRNYLTNEKDVIATFQRLSKMGVGTVQISGMKYDMPANDLKKLLDDTGISVCVTHNPFEKFKNGAEKLAEYHSIIGCDCIGIGSMPQEFRENGFAKLGEFVDYANKFSEVFAKYGKKFAYHNHAFELQGKVNGKKVYDILIDDTDKNVDFIMDTYWIRFAGENNEEYIKKLKGRITNIHLKDYKSKILFFKFPHWVELGKGELDFPRLTKLAVENGAKNALYEQDICRNPWKSTEISWQYMKEKIM